MHAHNLALTLADRCYRLLLLLYPRPFRREFAREMALVFRDASRRAYQRDGLDGLLTLWLATFADLIATALKERAAEVIDMSNTRFIRLSGLSGAAGGLILAVGGVVSYRNGAQDWPASPLEIPLAFYGIALAIGLAGYYSLRAYDSLGRVGLGLAFAGALLISLGGLSMFLFRSDNSWNWNAWFFGTALHLAGLIIFGFSVWRGRFLAQGNLLPLLAGLVPGLAMLAGIGLDSDLWSLLFFLSAGLGWVALGLLLARLAGEPLTPLPAA